MHEPQIFVHKTFFANIYIFLLLYIFLCSFFITAINALVQENDRVQFVAWMNSLCLKGKLIDQKKKKLGPGVGGRRAGAGKVYLKM